MGIQFKGRKGVMKVNHHVFMKSGEGISYVDVVQLKEGGHGIVRNEVVFQGRKHVRC